MRGALVSTLSVRYGSRSTAGVPGVVWGVGVPCRIVPQREISQLQLPFNFSAIWFTTDLGSLHGPVTSVPFNGAVFTDYFGADEVTFQTIVPVWYVICRHERVTPFGAVAYHRWMAIPRTKFTSPPMPPLVPPPPPPPPAPPVVVEPGTSCAVSPDITEFGEYTLSSLPGGAHGFYRAELSWSGPLYVKVIGGTPDGTVVYVGDCPLDHDCCSVALVASFTHSSPQCYEMAEHGDEPSPGALCFRVENHLGDDPVSLIIEIGEGNCPL